MFTSSRMTASGLFILALLALTPLTGNAAGLLTPVSSPHPPLEIRDHRVKAVIEDGYAVTEVEQVFHNPHGVDLEARYSFPVPEHAAVAEFSYWIDGQPVIGEVLEAAKAKQLYEDEKAAGREAGLAEKDSYKTFEIHVWPVKAGQDVRIRLVYVQEASVDLGLGRYNYPLEEGGVDEEKLAFWHRNEQVTGHFSFDLELKSGYGVDAVRIPRSPGAVTQRLGPGHWKISIGNAASPIGNAASDAAELELGAQINVLEGQAAPLPAGSQHTLDQDILVYWRLQPDLPGAVDLVTHKPPGAKRGTFMMTLTPGDDLAAITEGRDWVFVLDLSGSMSGKLATLAAGIDEALGQLNPEDRFRIITFNNTSRELTSGFHAATPENVAHFQDRVRQLQTSGGTNLYAGLELGLRSLDADRTSSISLVTDGVANVGVTEKRSFIDLLVAKDVRLFTFVMGNSANRPLLEAMTKVSNGFALSVSNSDDITGRLLMARDKLTHEALHGVELSISGVKTADLTPRQIGTVYRGQQMIILGHYWDGGTADISLRGKVSGAKKHYQTSFEFPTVSEENPEIERLWAYAAIRHLIDEMDYLGKDPDLETAVTDLAVEYGLVTDYTSMVVVRDEVFDASGITRTNRDRVVQERKAREVRAQRPPVSRQADKAQPMYKKKRPSFGSGGGSIAPAEIGTLAVLVWLVWYARRRRALQTTSRPCRS